MKINLNIPTPPMPSIENFLLGFAILFLALGGLALVWLLFVEVPTVGLLFLGFVVAAWAVGLGIERLEKRQRK